MKSSHIYIYIHNIGYYIYTVHIGNSHLATSCCLMLFSLMYLCIQTYVNKSLKVKNELSFRMKVKAWVVRLYKHTLVCKCWLHLHGSGISVSWDDFGITLQEQPVRTCRRANDCKNSAQKQNTDIILTLWPKQWIRQWCHLIIIKITKIFNCGCTLYYTFFNGKH